MDEMDVSTLDGAAREGPAVLLEGIVVDGVGALLEVGGDIVDLRAGVTVVHLLGQTTRIGDNLVDSALVEAADRLVHPLLG